jgi:hypothetical protein
VCRSVAWSQASTTCRLNYLYYDEASAGGVIGADAGFVFYDRNEP